MRPKPGNINLKAGWFFTFLWVLISVFPIIMTLGGAFLNLEWYGQRSEGADSQGTISLFLYVWNLWRQSLIHSIELILVVIPLALLIGVPAAYAFSRYPFRGSSFIETLVLTPLSIPGIALAVSYLYLYGGMPRFSLLIAGHLAFTLPLVIKTTRNGLERMNPQWEESARILGAGFGERVWKISLPLLSPSIVLSSILVFTVSWGEFNASFLLMSPLTQTYPGALYLTFTTNSFPVASAATFLFLLPVVPALYLIQKMGGETFNRGLQA